MLDRTGAYRGSSSCYREGVPSAVVFEISPSHVKTFHYRPQHSQPPPPGLPVRCATSLRWLCSRQVRRPSHYVQVQSPISTAHLIILRKPSILSFLIIYLLLFRYILMSRSSCIKIGKSKPSTYSSLGVCLLS